MTEHTELARLWCKYTHGGQFHVESVPVGGTVKKTGTQPVIDTVCRFRHVQKQMQRVRGLQRRFWLKISISVLEHINTSLQSHILECC